MPVTLSAGDMGRMVAGLLTGLRAVSVNGEAGAAAATFVDASVCDQASTALTAAALALPALCRGREALLASLIRTATTIPTDSVLLGQTHDDIAVIRDDPKDFEIETRFYRLTGDLSRGEVMQHLWSPHGVSVAHTGNLVEFKSGRQEACLDAENGISAFGLSWDGKSVVLWHTTPVSARVGMLSKASREIGHLQIEYRVSPGSAVLGVSSELRVSHALDEVRVTTALDRLDGHGFNPEVGYVCGGGEWMQRDAPKSLGAKSWSEGLPDPSIVLTAAEHVELRPALHIRSVGLPSLHSLTAEARTPGALHWLLMRYGSRQLPAGRSLVAREERLLVPRGPWKAIAEALRGPPVQRGDDPKADLLVVFGVCEALRLAHGRQGLLGPDTTAAAYRWLRRELKARLHGPGSASELVTRIMLTSILAEMGNEADLPNLDRMLTELVQRIRANDADLTGNTEEFTVRAIAFLIMNRHCRLNENSLEIMGRLIEDAEKSLIFKDKKDLSTTDLIALAFFARGARFVLASSCVTLDPISIDRFWIVLAGAINALRQTLYVSTTGVVANVHGGGHSAALASILLALLEP